MFLCISMFIRMVEPDTESTTNISSTLRFKVLVGQYQDDSLLECGDASLIHSALNQSHGITFLNTVLLISSTKISQICLNIHPADHKVMSVILIM